MKQVDNSKDMQHIHTDSFSRIQSHMDCLMSTHLGFTNSAHEASQESSSLTHLGLTNSAITPCVLDTSAR